MGQPTTTAPDRLLSAAEVSEWLGTNQNTLRYWRWEGRGPKWFRLGAKTIKYRESDVRDWLDAQYAEVNGAA